MDVMSLVKKADENLLKQVSERTGKSQKMILFEFMKDKHPKTFQHWLLDEQLRKNGIIQDNDKTVIELVDGELVETPLQEVKNATDICVK